MLHNANLIITNISLSLCVFIYTQGCVSFPLPQIIVGSTFFKHHLMTSPVWLTGSFFPLFCILYSNCLINLNLCTKCMLLSGECSFKQLSVLLLLVCDVFWTSVDIFLLSQKRGRAICDWVLSFYHAQLCGMAKSVYGSVKYFNVAARLQGTMVG